MRTSAAVAVGYEHPIDLASCQSVFAAETFHVFWPGDRVDQLPGPLALSDIGDLTRVDMELALGEERVALEVTDNGVGIADSDLNGKKSLGLLGMHERALLFGGEVKISGTPGHGTRVSVSIPIRQRA